MNIYPYMNSRMVWINVTALVLLGRSVYSSSSPQSIEGPQTTMMSNPSEDDTEDTWEVVNRGRSKGTPELSSNTVKLNPNEKDRPANEEWAGMIKVLKGSNKWDILSVKGGNGDYTYSEGSEGKITQMNDKCLDGIASFIVRGSRMDLLETLDKEVENPMMPIYGFKHAAIAGDYFFMEYFLKKIDDANILTDFINDQIVYSPAFLTLDSYISLMKFVLGKKNQEKDHKFKLRNDTHLMLTSLVGCIRKENTKVFKEEIVEKAKKMSGLLEKVGKEKLIYNGPPKATRKTLDRIGQYEKEMLENNLWKSITTSS